MTSFPLISHRMFVAAVQDANGAPVPHAPVKEAKHWPPDGHVDEPAVREDRTIREPGLKPAALPAQGA